MGLTKLVIRGARQHNLKNIDVEIPRNSLTVITGLSGSGKSSLAFDTIYAEGQRRYVESLSAYARQFLDQMERPEVDVIEGLSPSIAIEQKTTTRSPRSTVGTITEIYDYLRVVYASVGAPHCPNCGKPITRQSSEQIVQSILHGEICQPDDRIMILAPIVRGRKGAYRKELEKFAQDGYVRVRINGELFPLDDLPAIDKRKNHTIEIVIDRLLVKQGIASRLEQSITTALKLAGGLVTVASSAANSTRFQKNLPAPIAGFPFRNSSRAHSALTRPMERARRATAWVQNMISIPPESWRIGRDRFLMAAWGPVPAQPFSKALWNWERLRTDLSWKRHSTSSRRGFRTCSSTAIRRRMKKFPVPRTPPGEKRKAKRAFVFREF